MSERPFLPASYDDPFLALHAREFSQLCQARAVRALDGEAAADRWLSRIDAASRVGKILKAAIPAATTSDSGYAGDIAADYRNIVGAFSTSLRSDGFFMALLENGFARVPMRSRAGVITVGASAWAVGEGLPKPISRVTVANQEITPRKAVGLLVATKETITAVGASGQLLFENELRRAVAQAVDEVALSVLLAGITPTPSAGPTFPDAVTDLRALLGGIETRGGPVVLITDRATAIAAGLLATTAGFAFATRGEMGGLPIYVSDAVDPGMLIAVNCATVAADSDSIEVSASRQAAVEMLDSALVQNGTTGAGTNLVSLWQDNSVGLKVEVAFGLEKIRDDGVAAVSGIAYGSAAP
jgi:hypothetical protein